ncbi:hypothetical protein C8Q77DRAFT_1113584 [Trametes polyzona]|nr:hypothetical protein C8Q77DRAFT_1113584 [Trametes polyzona]
MLLKVDSSRPVSQQCQVGRGPPHQTRSLSSLYDSPYGHCPSITCLQIHSVRAHNSLGILLSFLGKNPQLEILHITDYTLNNRAAHISLDGWLNVHGLVPLPNLQLFVLDETHATSLDTRAAGQAYISKFQRMLIARLALPSSCITKIGVLAIEDLKEVTAALLGSDPTATHLRFTGSSPRRLGDSAGFDIRLLDTRYGVDITLSAAHLIPSYDVCPAEISTAIDEAQAQLGAVFTSLPAFSAIRNLWLRVDDLWGLQGPRSFLPSFPRLEFLVVQIRALPTLDFATAIVRTILQPLELHGDHVVCPSLSTLVVLISFSPSEPQEHTSNSSDTSKAKFRPCTCPRGMKTSSGSAMPIMELVAELARARRDAGCHALQRALVVHGEVHCKVHSPIEPVYEYGVDGKATFTERGRGDGAEVLEREWIR